MSTGEEREQRADVLVSRYTLAKYRESGEAENAHLKVCPEAVTEDPESHNGTYGCDTGCEYVRFEATITCPHGQREDFEWGTFGELSYILEDLEADEAVTR